MTTFIIINQTSYPTNTTREIEDAQYAMAEAGIESALVFAGDPEDPDSITNGQKICAESRRRTVAEAAEILEEEGADPVWADEDMDAECRGCAWEPHAYWLMTCSENELRSWARSVRE